MISSRGSVFKGFAVLALSLGVWALSGCPAAADTDTPAARQAIVSKEYQLKAAFLYNFAKFVEWPAQINQEIPDVFIIGIFGDDPFGKDIDELLANKTIQDRKILIKRFRSLNELEPCHILFIHSSEAGRLGQIMEHLRDKSILTVSEGSIFTSNGGMINFVMEENKVRFEINKQATDKAGLRLSSQLLKLAKSVIA